MNKIQAVWTAIKTYPLGVGLVVAAILMASWTFLFRQDALGLGLFETLDQAQQDSDTLKQSLSVVNKNVIAGHSLVVDKDHPERPSDVDQEKADLKKFDDVLIDPADTFSNQAYFYDFEKSTGVRIIDPSAGITTSLKEPAGVSTTVFTLGALGDWNKITSFLYGLQSSPHLLRFNTFRLEKSKETATGDAKGDTKQLSITLEVEVSRQMKPFSIIFRLCRRPLPVAALAAAWAAALVILPAQLSADDAAAAPAAPAEAPKPPPPPGPLTWIFSKPAEGEVVDAKLRDKLLTTTEHNLNRGNPDILTYLEGATDPFFIKPPPPPPTPVEANPTSTNPVPDAPPPPPSISDAERLQQVAESLDATGILVRGQVHVLVTDHSGSLQVGAPITVTFPGDAQSSKITIIEIGVNTYSLKLNDTVLPNIKLTETAPNASVVSTRQAKTAPPPPPPPPPTPPAVAPAPADSPAPGATGLSAPASTSSPVPASTPSSAPPK